MRPPADELVRLRADASCTMSEDGGLLLSSGPHAEVLTVREDSARFLLPGLAESLGTHEPLRAWPDHRAVPDLLELLRCRGWLSVTVLEQGHARYTLTPLRAPDTSEVPVTITPKISLSRFAVMRAGEGGTVLESPLAWCALQIHDPGLLAVIGTLASPASHRTTAERDFGSERLLHDLSWGGFLVADKSAEENESRRRQWAPHELWFHYRSRIADGTETSSFGGTWWGLARFEPLPASPPRCPDRPRVSLHHPDLAELRQTDPSLTAVVEERVSLRTGNDAAPLTARHLGEFLYRCARNRRQWTKNGIEYLSRPYPAGGSMYELELYVTARKVVGIDPGLYRYDPAGHCLERISGIGTPARRLLVTAARSSGVTQLPQVLFTITARMGRIMLKYESMAYALVLKDVGVLYQTMYLAATAMGLAPCALGAGDTGTLAAVAGLDPLEECCVGEFMLASRPGTNDG